MATVTPRLAVLAAIDTDGKVWFSLNHSKTDSTVIRLFFGHLCRQLDQETPAWRECTRVCMDNAKYHVSQETRETLRRLRVPIILTGPSSYSSSPIETLFAGLKRGDLNPMKAPLGKK